MIFLTLYIIRSILSITTTENNMTKDRISLLRRHKEITRQIYSMLYTRSGAPKAILSHERKSHELALNALRIEERSVYNKLRK